MRKLNSAANEIDSKLIEIIALSLRKQTIKNSTLMLFVLSQKREQSFDQIMIYGRLMDVVLEAASMALSDSDKKLRGKIYQSKSEESILAAADCFNHGHYRSVFNRCWYATMQAISAGVYLYLPEQNWPPLTGERANWKHSLQRSLFVRLCKHFDKYVEHRDLIPHLDNLLEWRENADYHVEESVSKQQAYRALQTTQRVLKAMESIPCGS